MAVGLNDVGEWGRKLMMFTAEYRIKIRVRDAVLARCTSLIDVTLPLNWAAFLTSKRQQGKVSADHQHLSYLILLKDHRCWMRRGRKKTV